ncbi:unnamed protein product [Parnassius apollo]|uniref:(apollo) hypothetical protein n=1 Tax=Parnassius apollo TaxID=110799 RepID=A0A8S3W4B7_PARAO|nr:unnamed protein product [Parnassius apollo]
MPTEDVSDLRDVVDAINRLCETMKTSGYEETEYEDCTDVTWKEEIVESSDVVNTEELVSPEEVAVQKVETYVAERWSDTSLVEQTEESENVTSDTDQTAVFCEPISEMYYTASSEVSLLSDMEFPERVHDEGKDLKDDRQNVIAGHVAAMRERFESMTRANTPCPDVMRSLSPSLDMFRNITPSPDRLDE